MGGVSGVCSARREPYISMAFPEATLTTNGKALVRH